MSRSRTLKLTLGIVFILVSVLQFSNISQIPFHPDESSLLFQSSDFEELFKDPKALSFNPTSMDDIAQTYRILNPPLPKYILAVGRNLAGYGAERVATDWDWSIGWDENSASGALPVTGLLNASRAASTLMVILSLVICYLIGKRIHSPALGIVTVILIGTNALVTLHGRRAMAEGTLLFGISIALLGILEGNRKPWLSGLGAALAICTKLSAGALAPVAFFAVLWQPSSTSLKHHIRNISQFFISFSLFYFLVNPLIWRNPLGAIQAQWTERTRFLEEMTDQFTELAPNQVLDEPIERFSVLIAHLFFTEPQIAEVGNYLEATAASEAAYRSLATANLFRGFVGGGLFLTFVGLGVSLWILELKNLDDEAKRKSTLLFLSSTALIMALLWAIPLPFQRYYIPLVPVTSLWMGFGIIQSTLKIKQAISDKRQPVNSSQ